jgi:hypothetical protein
MSLHEESAIAGEGPAIGVFNNLVLYDQLVPQSCLNSIVPDRRGSPWCCGFTTATAVGVLA